MNDHYPFSLKPLPYAYDALEPYISEETLRFHHDKHLKAYVDKLNETLKPYPEFQDWSLKALIVYSDGFPKEIKTDVKNNAGGVYNHGPCERFCAKWLVKSRYGPLLRFL